MCPQSTLKRSCNPKSIIKSPTTICQQLVRVHWSAPEEKSSTNKLHHFTSGRTYTFAQVHGTGIGKFEVNPKCLATTLDSDHHRLQSGTASNGKITRLEGEFSQKSASVYRTGTTLYRLNCFSILSTEASLLDGDW